LLRKSEGSADDAAPRSAALRWIKPGAHDVEGEENEKEKGDDEEEVTDEKEGDSEGRLRVKEAGAKIPSSAPSSFYSMAAAASAAAGTRQRAFRTTRKLLSSGQRGRCRVGRRRSCRRTTSPPRCRRSTTSS